MLPVRLAVSPKNELVKAIPETYRSPWTIVLPLISLLIPPKYDTVMGIKGYMHGVRFRPRPHIKITNKVNQNPASDVNPGRDK
jgi:hypothetical protein